MAGPTETREREIRDAIADTIVARTNLLPQTTLTAATAVGDDTLAVADVAGFQKRGYVHWFDDTGEKMGAIKAIDSDAKTLTLDYQGYAEHGYPIGLKFDHAEGAVIATNLMLHRPLAINPMLRGGLPVVTIWPRRKSDREHTFGSTLAPMVVRIQIHLAIQQYEAAPIDPEVYNQIQQDGCQDALQIVNNALNQNRHLMARYNAPGNHANGLGDGKNNGQFAESMWDVVIEAVEIPQAVGAMDVTVRPLRYVRQEPS